MWAAAAPNIRHIRVCMYMRGRRPAIYIPLCVSISLSPLSRPPPLSLSSVGFEVWECARYGRPRHGSNLNHFSFRTGSGVIFAKLVWYRWNHDTKLVLFYFAPRFLEIFQNREMHAHILTKVSATRDFSCKTCDLKPVCASRMSIARSVLCSRPVLLQASKERVCLRTQLHEYLNLKYCAPLVQSLVATDGASKTVTLSVVANQRLRLSSDWL